MSQITLDFQHHSKQDTQEIFSKEELLEMYLNKDFDLRGLSSNPAFYKVFNLNKLGWKWEVFGNKRSAGMCKMKPKIIYISDYIFNDDAKYQTNLINTILHEIAHAIDYEIRNRSAHDKTWRAIARHIGCSGERCINTSDFDLGDSKYSLTCPTCHNVTRAHRKPKREYVCTRCFKPLKEKYGRLGAFKHPDIINVTLTLKQNY